MERKIYSANKMVFCVKLADVAVEIHSLYEMVYRMCKPYLIEQGTDHVDFTVEITEEDILFERKKSEETYDRTAYSAAYLETLAVYRKIAEKMLQYNTLLMHGAVIGIDQNAYMVTAPSGTGKTSYVTKLLENIENSYMINGDKPLIKIDAAANITYACGTPWAGKERLQTNCIVPLRAIFLLERGEENSLQKITFAKAFPRLLQQVYKSENAEMMKTSLSLLSQLSKHVEFYHLQVKYYSNLEEMGEEAVRLLIEHHFTWKFT